MISNLVALVGFWSSTENKYFRNFRKLKILSFKCEPHFTISFKLRKYIIWKFFVRKIFSFLICPLSIYSIIYLYQCGFIDINLLDCNLIRSVFCCSKHFSLCHLELLVGSCVLFTCPNKFFLFCFFWPLFHFLALQDASGSCFVFFLP